MPPLTDDDQSSLKEKLEAIERENARLTSENNSLHLQLINSADLYDQQALKTSLVIRQLEQELQDLRFLNSQHKLTIQKEKERLEELNRRASDLFKKWQLVGATQHQSISASQRILLPLGPLSPSSSHPSHTIIPHPPQPHIIDLMKLSELSASKQLDRANDAESRAHNLTSQIKECKAQLITRETEIHRLSNLLEKRPTYNNNPDLHMLQNVEYLPTNPSPAKDKDSSTDISHLRHQNAQLASNLESIQTQLNSLRTACENCLTSISENTDDDEIHTLKALLTTAREDYSLLNQRYERLQQQLDNKSETPALLESRRNSSNSTDHSVQTVLDIVDAETQTIDDMTPPLDPTNPSGDMTETHRIDNPVPPVFVDELKQLYDMASSLSQQVEQLLQERNNFELLYLQTSEKFGDLGSVNDDSPDRSIIQCTECPHLQASLQARMADLAQCRSDLANSASQIASLERNLSQVTEELHASNDLKLQYTDMQSTQIELTKTLSEQARVIQELNSQISKGLARASEETHSEVDKAKSALHLLEIELATCKTSCLASKDALDLRANELVQAQRRVQVLTDENKCLASEVANVASDLQTLFRENQQLSHELEHINNARTKDHDAITKLQQSLQAHKDVLRQAKSDQKQLFLSYTRLVSQFNTRGQVLSNLQVILSQLRQEIRVKDARIAYLASTCKKFGNKEPNWKELALEVPTTNGVHDGSKVAEVEQFLSQEQDGSLTKEWDLVRQELADDSSIMRRKVALQLARA